MWAKIIKRGGVILFQTGTILRLSWTVLQNGTIITKWSLTRLYL